jgi:transcription elongation factor Elf1
MDLDNIPIEPAVEEQKTTQKIVKRYLTKFASFDNGISKFEIMCPANKCPSVTHGQCFVEVTSKDKPSTIKCKHCNSEISKRVLSNVRDILKDSKIESEPVAVHNTDGEEVGFRTITAPSSTSVAFNVAFKHCPICRNKRVYLNTTKKAYNRQPAIYTRCGCGVRCYENITAVKCIMDGLTDDFIEKLFANLSDSLKE